MQTSPSPIIESRLGNTFDNLSIPVLYERSLQSNAARLAQGGSLVVSTGSHTGRSPKDRFIVDRPVTHDAVDWNEINQPLQPADYERLRDATLAYLGARDCYVQDLAAGADPTFQMQIRIVTPSAWHAIFAETMLIRPEDPVSLDRERSFTILHAPAFQPDPAVFGLRTSTFVVIDFDERLILIGGTEYAGEIKKSIFSTLNFLLPMQGVLPMHCSCNTGADGDVALFFGLSGTGKTTLSADPNRMLIGDDEHGWSDTGIFNFEGGCYAKVIGLRAESEPEIFEATHLFGTVIENAVLDPESRAIDFDDNRYTENTRAAYSLTSIPIASLPSVAGHPSNVVMLTADAFGVLPPVARLSTNQALYYFLSGYTSKIAGTEIGITEPVATFSAGFGAPFLPRRPTEYGHLLASHLESNVAQAWLVNTGWTGGPYGTGRRMPIDATRAIITAILDGQLHDTEWIEEPAFRLSIPAHCPGVSDNLLSPRETWEDPAAYDQAARKLATMFENNFARFAQHVTPDVVSAGPQSS